ncbi:DEAD/DEAH box helicase family protein (plasmid) [Arthrobacter sp. YA7-1]|uniref:helicase-related protein n=1 Tax=Arthrobacter sp. YA7-1 TaxID=2987701 RepID=UPI002226F440|nr:helicase-related protein [Arthrobacter sp. YA7-1]UYY83667.1 DEAD/DEAH box helicase family protein [Arthrobacter sp. YA7-1]
MFDKDDWAAERTQLAGVLSEREYAAASRTTINAYYTDAALVKEIWSAVERLGFTGGEVLEPGSGAGTFIGFAPEGARMTGVELDPLTASISRKLYPHASIRSESFADTPITSHSFDLAVGNVPFSKNALYDKTHNADSRHSMHNHFILKSLAAVKPGGYVAVLTSSFTLDAANPASRREMSAMADLVGAVRLPTGAHRRAAGTEALTDLLLLRKREPGREPANTDWETVGPVIIAGRNVKINNYFDLNPQNVLGKITVGNGMYGEETVSVKADDLTAVPQLLARRLDVIVTDALGAGLGHAPAEPAPGKTPAALLSEPGLEWDGTLTAGPDGTFMVARAGEQVPFPVPKAHAAELHALLGLRDGARSLLEMEASDSEDTPELSAQRTALAEKYTAYAAKYGPLNRFTETVRTDKESGEEIIARRAAPAVRILRQTDPFGALPPALENFNEETQTATPAALLRHRQVVARKPLMGADTVDEALAIALDTYGAPELEKIAELLGVTEEEARDRLGTLVFDDPETGKLVTAPEYLSGNVRTKLDAARAAAAGEARWSVNVTALEEVQPPRVGMEDVEARLGAVWISPEEHQQFVKDILADPTASVSSVGAGIWRVKANRGTVRSTNEWGTARRPAPDLLQSILEQKSIQVEDKDEDGKSVANLEETEAAQEKAEALQERFAEWVWEDPERAGRLLDEYNRRFNSLALRDYTKEGHRLSLPGLAKSFTPHPHQRTAVARIISEPAVGLFHEVGAGKTAEMVMGAMELKRLGMASKPMVVVPNHMLEQFTREWLELYPQARLLSAGSDDIKTRSGDVAARRQFVARAAANDWDGIIMTQQAFKSIGVKAETIEAYQEALIADVRQTIVNAQAEGEDRTTVKKLETKLQAEEERMKRLMDTAPDPGLTFEDTGVDYLFVDEAHDYKNLRTVTNIKGAEIAGSIRATDMHLKLEYLRRVHGERVVTMATGTPIANSITEAHVMQRYLRPDLLHAAGVENFDVWGATFGETVTAIEMDAGGRLKNKPRFAKFKNVPEMLRSFHVFADVKLSEDLNLKTPDLARRPEDGERQPELVLIAQPPELAEYMKGLADRLDSLSGWAEKGADNALSVYNDGRKAALDLRMVGIEPESGTKLDAVVAKTLAVWEENRENEYDTGFRSGIPSANKGALQIIFCDLSTPSKNTGPDGKPVWTAYQQLKDQLVAGGIQAEQIRFIQDSPKPEQKARLFAQCRSGEVAVLIGSTAMMGTGTNVQLRAKAIHHVTCPWRPADLTQRDGRIIRQGNANAEVHNFQYATVGSYDSAAWDGIQRKATMIQQVLRGRLDIREIEDVGDLALNAAQIKAATSGNPLVMEKIEADAARTKLERLKRAHEKGQSTLAWTRGAAETSITKAESKLPAVQAALPRIIPTAGEAFAASIDGRNYTKRAEAVAAISEWVRAHTPEYGNYYRQNQDYGTMVSLGGHELQVRNAAEDSRLGSYQDLAITLKDVPAPALVFTRMELLEGSAGIITRLENKVSGLPDYEAQLRQTITEKQAVLADVESQAGKPFKYEDKLIAARVRCAELEGKLQASIDPPKPPPSAEVSVTEVEVDPALARLRRLQAASFPAAPKNTHPQHTHPTPQGRTGAAPGHSREGGFER